MHAPVTNYFSIVRIEEINVDSNSNIDTYESDTYVDNCTDNVNRKLYIAKKPSHASSTHTHIVVSPWHDIKLYTNDTHQHDGVVTMVVEIPKNTREKVEINKQIKFNPLTYDIRKGEIRRIMYKNGYPAHYGALPQTWEDPNHIDERTGLIGDNDPMDAFDLSLLPTKSGDIVHIKVLGCIAMIDQGETDWKVIGINIKDPKSTILNDINDVPRDDMRDIIDFLRNYKVTEGKGQNTFHYRLLWDKTSTLEIIADQHSHWKKGYSESK